MNDRIYFRLDSTSFGEQVACAGDQVAEVVTLIEAALGPVAWTYFDLRAIGAVKLPKGNLWTTEEARLFCESVQQFESLVLFAIPFGSKAPPRLRRDPRTDDDPRADLGDAVAEVRAFDTTYIEVSLKREALRAAYASRRLT
jgi:hypothetical protein